MEIRLLDSAEIDVAAACAWYEEHEIGLSDRFRRLVLKKFPFCIYYVIENEILYVLAVFNAHRDPEYITKLLNECSTEI